jgi:VanZ family protein
MTKRIVLIIWIALIIFPIIGLGWLYPGLTARFNVIFRSNASHVVMHAALFAGLVILLLSAFDLKPGRRAIKSAILAVLIVAALQEGLQALSQGFLPLNAALYDLCVDFLGGALGYGIFFIFCFREDIEISV